MQKPIQNHKLLNSFIKNDSWKYDKAESLLKQIESESQ